MIKETFKQAVQNVLSNKVRTFLTMLGIIIGVMAVIVIVGLGNGMTNMMQDFYSDMGSDILSVNVMTASTRSVEVNDVYRIINEKPEYYKGLSPIASVGGDTLRVRSTAAPTSAASTKITRSSTTTRWPRAAASSTPI